MSNTVIDGVCALIMQYAPLLNWCRPQSIQLTRTNKECYSVKRQHGANVEHSVPCVYTRDFHHHNIIGYFNLALMIYKKSTQNT